MKNWSNYGKWRHPKQYYQTKIKMDKLTAARKYYEGQAAEAEVTINVYLNNSVGIGEHPQVMEELRGQIQLLTDARDNIDTIITLENNIKKEKSSDPQIIKG
tara:strand:+ start:40 stop:345 length:306 start_codon:yes stop_codon:yes gene_type:complete